VANELIRPIDENTAKAIEESAKALGAGFDLVGGLGAYLARALGGVPENLVGLLIGDWLIHKRTRRWSELQDETRRILDQRNVKEPDADISPSIAIPLIEAALDEDREGLKELWAKLLAAAMDPTRKGQVRLAFIPTLKKMDPLDARVLEAMVSRFPGGFPSGNGRQTLSGLLEVSQDEIVVSFENLKELNCIAVDSAKVNGNVWPFGKLLMEAVQ
jgi:Abortive infection alpha